MIQSRIFAGIFAFIGILSCRSWCYAQIDSLADCFPLSTGNQWVYHYDRTIPLSQFSTQRDTGIATYSILGRTHFADSVLWNVEERREIHRLTLMGGALQADSSIFDTTLFNLVELSSGNHELYRRTSETYQGDFNTAILWNSVWPFLYDLSDTSKLYRYHQLNSTDSITFSITPTQQAIEYTVTLKRNSGLQSLQLSGTGVWVDGPPGAFHKLLAQTIVSVPELYPVELPATVRLDQNYPNPFNPVTLIDYDVPTISRVTLAIYSVLGEEISRLVEWQSQIGHHTVQFDGSNLPSGFYFAKLTSEKSTIVRKMLLIR
jgi:hypothetical protein